MGKALITLSVIISIDISAKEAVKSDLLERLRGLVYYRLPEHITRLRYPSPKDISWNENNVRLTYSTHKDSNIPKKFQCIVSWACTVEGRKALEKLKITDISMRFDTREYASTLPSGPVVLVDTAQGSEAGQPPTPQPGHELQIDASHNHNPPPMQQALPPSVRRHFDNLESHSDVSATEDCASRVIPTTPVCDTDEVHPLPRQVSYAAKIDEAKALRLELEVAQEKLAKAEQATEQAAKRAHAAEARLVEEQEELGKLRHQMQGLSRVSVRERDLRVVAEAALEAEQKKRKQAETSADVERQRWIEDTTAARTAYQLLENEKNREWIEAVAALETEQNKLKQVEDEQCAERQRWSEGNASMRSAYQLLEDGTKLERIVADAALEDAQTKLKQVEATLSAERQKSSEETASACAAYQLLESGLEIERIATDATLAAEQQKLQQSETRLNDERRRWAEEIASARNANQHLECALETERKSREKESAAAQVAHQGLEAAIEEERRRREEAEWEAMVAERTLTDVERECREPFVVPALLAAMRKMSRVTCEAMKDPNA